MDFPITQVGENDYYLYGLDFGDTDATGKSLSLEKSTYMFTLSDATNKAKVESYLNNFCLAEDPSTKMFWPIWQVFVNSSNGKLNNDGY